MLHTIAVEVRRRPATTAWTVLVITAMVILQVLETLGVINAR